MTNQRIPIFPVVTQAFAFLLSHWRPILRIVWLPMLIVCFAAAWMVTYLPDVNLMTLEEGAAADAMRPFAFTNIVSSLIFFLTSIMIYVAVFQLFFEDVRPTRLFYLRWDMDEWRVAGTLVAQYAILFGYTFAALFGLSIAYTIALLIASALGTDISFLTQIAESGDLEALFSHPLNATLIIFFGVIFVLGLFWMSLRMWCFVPHVVQERRVALKEAWNLSKGHISRLLAIVILTALPIYFVGSLVLVGLDMIVLNHAFEDYGSITAWSPGLTQAPDINPHERLPSLMFAAALSQLLMGVVVVALVSAQACSYRYLIALNLAQEYRDGESS